MFDGILWGVETRRTHKQLHTEMERLKGVSFLFFEL